MVSTLGDALPSPMAELRYFLPPEERAARRSDYGRTPTLERSI